MPLCKVLYVVQIILLAYLGYYTSIRSNRSDSSRGRIYWLVLVSEPVWRSCLSTNLRAYFDLHISRGGIPTARSIISYLLDVYRGHIAPEPHFKTFLLYVAFWPQLFAGPIVRAREFIPQIWRTSGRGWDRGAEGCKKILSGLFLKVVLADQLAPLIDTAFQTDPAYLGGLDVMTMSFGFGLQIYSILRAIA